ncbi:hypothetical protein BVX98_03735, partial [bacterium F11]
MDRIVIQPREDRRIDRFLAEQYPNCSRMYFKKLINARLVKVDQHPVSAHHKLKAGQVVTVEWPKESTLAAPVKLADLPFGIIFEDKTILVINKPPGILVHPATQWKKNDTVAEILQSRLETSGWPDHIRPGLVHRLDRDT